ncbi:BPSL0067 family protein [Roseateles sp. SL47]|uniref:BPSL0067 family protein n=1 Tax=Roseateles sp. SL47 TaxID=2995138 RepID=UPI002270A93B|nr:BPSL0067 family protein [Roseateles sp. SL47]WAC75218.1 BPSL0067 family protein [Roseateles sp. SL47]
MPCVDAKGDDLENTDKVGSKQCVALVQRYANAPMTALWKEGEPVGGVKLLTKGTVIATFVDGKYESNSTGNHAITPTLTPL